MVDGRRAWIKDVGSLNEESDSEACGKGQLGSLQG